MRVPLWILRGWDMKDVDIEVGGSRVIIDFGRTGLNTESLAERAKEVLPLLHALLFCGRRVAQAFRRRTSVFASMVA